MNDKKILHIIKQLKELYAIVENELIIEDNFICIPSTELIRFYTIYRMKSQVKNLLK